MRKRNVTGMGSKTDFRKLKIQLISKIAPAGSVEEYFGDTADKYEFWQPHLCGVCCVKMIADAVYTTNSWSLAELVDTFVKTKAFRISGNGAVEGAFHYPMKKVLASLGINSHVVRKISVPNMAARIENGAAVILSVDLGRITSGDESGGHLVLVTNYNRDRDVFTVYDSLGLLGRNGVDNDMSSENLAYISNCKGLIVG